MAVRSGDLLLLLTAALTWQLISLEILILYGIYKIPVRKPDDLVMMQCRLNCWS